MVTPRVKTQARGQDNRPRALNEVLYISVAEILLDIQQNLRKYAFPNLCIFVKNGKITIQYHRN